MNKLYFFLFFILILSFSSHSANNQEVGKVPVNYFYLRIKIQHTDYNHHILPLTKIMQSEFISTLQFIHPLYKSNAELQQTQNVIQENLDIWRQKKCPTEDIHACFLIIKEIYQQFRQFESILLTYQEFPLTQNQQPNQASVDEKGLDPINVYLEMLSNLDELTNINSQILHLLEGVMISYSMKRTSILEKSPLFFQLFRQLKLGLEQMMFKGLPSDIQKLYLTVWSNFFKIIGQGLPPKNHIKLLENSLESLNFTWHSFHMPLSKGHIKINPSVLTLLNSIQNRWNTILKVILR